MSSSTSSPFFSSSCWCLYYFILIITAVVAPAPCPSNDAVIGFTTIDEINHVMTKELKAIQRGAAPKPPYIFSLCPNTTFYVNSSGPLRLLLNGSHVACGATSALSDLCIVDGGAVQVSISDSIVPGYSLQDVSFQGIIFRGATETSIEASAGNDTMALFADCQWDVSCDFHGMIMRI